MDSCKSSPIALPHPSVLYENLLPHGYKIPPQAFNISVRVVPLLLDNDKLFIPSTANDASKNMRVSYFRQPLCCILEALLRTDITTPRRLATLCSPVQSAVVLSWTPDSWLALLICTTGVPWPYKSNIGKPASFPRCWEYPHYYCPCYVSHNST